MSSSCWVMTSKYIEIHLMKTKMLIYNSLTGPKISKPYNSVIFCMSYSSGPLQISRPSVEYFS